MVREAGAKEVWLRVASPPLRWPCYLGIDMPSREELIINSHADEAGVQAYVGVDSLRYLSEERLHRATGNAAVCMACMNGRYPL
jgi:amidophosphoribosyltransferase